jgi:hypothetical protein
MCIAANPPYVALTTTAVPVQQRRSTNTDKTLPLLTVHHTPTDSGTDTHEASEAQHITSLRIVSCSRHRDVPNFITKVAYAALLPSVVKSVGSAATVPLKSSVN